MDLKKYRFYPDSQTGCLSDDDTKTYFSRIGLSVFVFGVLSTLVSTLLVLLIQRFLTPVISNGAILTAISHLVNFTSIYAVAMPVLCFMLKPLPTVTPIKEKLPAKRLFGGFCVCMLFMIIGNYISNLVLTWLQLLLDHSATNPVESIISPTDPATVAVTVVFVVIVGPILEELLFRKILCDKLLPLGEGYAIVISAAIFGLFHGNFYQAAYAFLLGLIFALIYVKTGKLVYSTVYHMIINLLGSVIGPWVLSQIDLDKLMAILEKADVEGLYSMMGPIFLLYIYEGIMIAPAIVGLVLVLKERKRRTLSLDKGLLPPPKEHRLANIFCNVGVAACIAYFAFTFVISLKM